MKDRIKGYSKKLWKVLKKPEMEILPANIAFYIILAIIPLLTIVVLIASSFGISIDSIANMIDKIMPSEVSRIIIDAISGKGFDKSVGLFNIIAFLLASNGTYAIITTSDTLYKIKRNSYLQARISSIIILFIVIILFVFLLIVPIFGENIIKLMTSAKILSNYSDNIVLLFNLLKWPITLFIIYFNITLIYTIAPSKNIKSSETTYGAICTTLGWIGLTIVFKFYLAHFARYDIIYGNLASIIIMMVWTYLLSYIFVLGLAINASRREEREMWAEQARLEEERLAKEKLKAEKKAKKEKEENNKKEESSTEK